MKKIKIKKCNNLYILAILAILALLFIIIMSITMKMKETYYIPSPLPDDYMPNQIEKSSTSDSQKTVMYLANTYYANNSANFTDKPYDACLDACLDNKTSCKGITTNTIRSTSNPNPTGRCWQNTTMTENNRRTSPSGLIRSSIKLAR